MVGAAASPKPDDYTDEHEAVRGKLIWKPLCNEFMGLKMKFC